MFLILKQGCTKDKKKGIRMIKIFKIFVISLFFVFCTNSNVLANTKDLPGVPLTEPATVTPVDLNSGVTVRKVSFLRSNNILLVGNLFLPKDFNINKKYPAIIAVHPAGSVKEQSSGLYAYKLAEKGFVTLAFDSTYAGESGGVPYASEMPYDRVEDIRYAIDYLVTLPFVNENKIGALGLCAGGGYVIATAPTERRIRAVAGVSAADIGAANREGWLRNRTVDEQIKILEDVAKQRTKEARGADLKKVYMCPEPDKNTAPSFRVGYEYYRTSRAMHPRANNLYLYRSFATKMAFSAIENIYLVTQPTLLIAGENADSKWQTERFYKALPDGNKEVFTIKKASHIDLYDKAEYVNQAVDKLAEFFNTALNK